MSEVQDRLLQVAQDHAVLRGEFTLSSGAKSSYYIDGKLILQAPEAVMLLGQLVWHHAKSVQAEAIGGLATGCIPMSDAAVAYDSFHRHNSVRGFYVRPHQKEHGIKERVYQAFHPDGQPLVGPGRRVLVVDDVLTTGNSISQAIEEIEKRGAEVVGILVIIDRDAPESEARLKSRYRVDALFKSKDGMLYPSYEVPLGEPVRH